MNKIILLLLGSSVSLGLVSLHLVHELRTERDNSQSLQARIDALQGATAAALPAPPPQSLSPAASESLSNAPAPSVASAPPPRATATFTVVPGPPVAAVAMAASGPRMAQMPSQDEHMRTFRESMERQRALLQNAEYREAMLAQQKMMLARSYADLDKELDLDAEQYDQLMTLLANQQLRAMEDQRPWVEGTPDPSMADQLHRKYQQQQQANEAELASLIGTDKARAWKDYQSTMGVRHQVTQLRSTLAAAGTPLEQDQVKPLLKVLASEQQRLMKDYEKDARRGASMQPQAGFNQVQLQERQLERTTQYNKRLRDAVSQILTAEQLRQFERDQNEQVRMQEVQMRMMRAQAEAAARGEIPPQQGLMFQQGYISPAR